MDTKYWLGHLSEWFGVIAIVMIAGISPMLKRIRRVEFRYPRREGIYSLSLYALAYLVAFQYFANPFFDFLKSLSTYFGGGELAERMVLAVVCLIPFLLAMILRGQPLKSIGWGKENFRAGLITGFLLVLLVLFLRGKFLSLIDGVSSEEAGLLLVWTLLAIAEETIFRGYIQLRLSSFLGSTWGFLATVALYLLWQLPGRIWVLPFTEMWPALLVALIQGVLLGWIMRKSGHVLAPALYRIAAGWFLLI